VQPALITDQDHGDHPHALTQRAGGVGQHLDCLDLNLRLSSPQFGQPPICKPASRS
jgi:hypothetical protein